MFQVSESIIIIIDQKHKKGKSFESRKGFLKVPVLDYLESKFLENHLLILD